MLITCPKCSAKYQVPPEIKLVAGKKMQCSACQHVFEFVPPVQEEPIEKGALLPPKDAVLSMTAKTMKVTVQSSDSKLATKSPALLPEAFHPIREQNATQNMPYFWIVLCGILLLGLSVLGWLHRDLFFGDYEMASLILERPLSRKLPLKTNKVTSPKRAPVEKPLIIPDIPLDLEEDLPATTKLKEIPPASLSAFSIQSVRFRKSPTGEAILIEGVLKNVSQEANPSPEKLYALAYGEDGTILFEKEIYLPAGILPSGAEQAFFGTYAPAMEGVQWIDVLLQK